MAVAFDAASGNGEAANSTPNSWTHTPVGTPRAIIVYAVVNQPTSTVDVTGVTYGGVAMTEVSGSPNDKSTGEPGNVSAWFLGSSIPTGAQTVSVAYTNNATGGIRGEALSYTAAADCEVVDSDATINSDSLENPSVTLSLGGRTCACAIGLFSGHDATTSIAPLANWTSQFEGDFGTQLSGFYTYDIVGTTDVTAGWTQTAEDAVAIALAISEVAATNTRRYSLTMTGVG